MHPHIFLASARLYSLTDTEKQITNRDRNRNRHRGSYSRSLDIETAILIEIDEIEIDVIEIDEIEIDETLVVI